MRLTINPSIWTRSPRIEAISSQSSASTMMPWWSRTGLVRSRLSAMTSLRSMRAATGGALRSRSRTCRAMSAARRPLPTTPSMHRLASSKLGGSLCSHRKAALALSRMAESGWFTSCTIYAVLSPIVVDGALGMRCGSCGKRWLTSLSNRAIPHRAPLSEFSVANSCKWSGCGRLEAATGIARGAGGRLRRTGTGSMKAAAGVFISALPDRWRRHCSPGKLRPTRTIRRSHRTVAAGGEVRRD